MGFDVDPEPVIKCADTLYTIQQHALDLAELAYDANPDSYTWGPLAGAVFAPAYWRVADGLYRHLGQMCSALADRADTLSDCAQAYAEAEAKIHQSMTDIAEKLRTIRG